MLDQRGRHHRGFALAELAAVLVVVLLTLALAIPMARRARLEGWDVVDAENLHRFAAATGSYAADSADRYWTFSWRMASFPGEALPTEYNDLKFKNDTDLRAAAAQAIDILRRKAGREEIQYINNWMCSVYYSHLPLLDYLNQSMPASWGICPGDRMRQLWSSDPGAFDKGEFLPCQPTPSNDNKRWPYSSSYELSTSFFDQSSVGSRIYQAWAHNLYFVPNGAQLHGRLLGQTAFPSEKVHLYESAQHHIDEDTPDRCAAPQLWLVPVSRVAILFTDGHTGLMKTGDSNPGWQPHSPDSPDPTMIGDYPGAYRWTRNYLAGRDFGGPEIGPP